MRAASLFISMLLTLSAVAGELPLVPFPEGVHIATVGENLTVYGLPLMAYEYFINKSPAEAADFYRQAWHSAASDSDAAQSFLETHINSWLVLSRLECGHNITVQFADAGLQGTHVLIGVSPLPEFLLSHRKNQMILHIPRLGDAKIASVVASKDRGRISEVYWIEWTDTVDAILLRYKQHYETARAKIKGYRVVDDQSGRANYGTLTVNDNEASYRFDAVRGDDKKTRVIATWQPH